MLQTTTMWKPTAKSQSKSEPYEPVGVNLATGCLVDGQPNWDDISFDVHCSRCGYNLRMLIEPRCPECGLTFEWLELLNHSLHRSPFLFEHNWRKQPVGSWLATVRRAFRPRQFWQSVSIHDDIRPGPLWVMLLTAPVLFAVAMAATLYAMSIIGLWLGHVIFGTALPMDLFSWRISAVSADPLTHLAVVLRSMVHNIVRGQGTAMFLLPLPVVMLAAMLAVLCSMRQTLGRCRIRRVHLLRVVTYVATPVCLLWSGLLAVDLAGENASLPKWLAIGLFSSCMILIAGVPAFYLRSGLKHYLHLPRPTWVAAAASAIAALLMFVLFTLVALLTLIMHR